MERGQQPTKDKASITLCYVCHAVAHDIVKDMCESRIHHGDDVVLVLVTVESGWNISRLWKAVEYIKKHVVAMEGNVKMMLTCIEERRGRCCAPVDCLATAGR